MDKTLKISFSLKNTYRVNSILYSLKQLPVVKKVLPEALYCSKGLKVFANVLSIAWEVISAFLGKALYLLAMVYGATMLYDTADKGELFLHILIFLTIIGSFVNTYMFNPTRDKYYAMILMRMDARRYTLVNYTYTIAKVFIGFLASAVAFGLLLGVSLWQCLLIPVFVVGLKLTVAAAHLYRYEKKGTVSNENKLGKLSWMAVLLLLGAAYGLPAIGIVASQTVFIASCAVSILLGAAAVYKIKTFRFYAQMYKEILSKAMFQMDNAKQLSQQLSEKTISTDSKITSNKKGFEFLNELFVKRHQKILWSASKKITFVCICFILGVLLIFYLVPQIKKEANEMLMTFLPYFVFIMYAINRGTGFTRALFMNCDHSLLTYSFYKQPKFVLKLFKIRLREIIKVNLLPAAVIGVGLASILYASGGTENWMDYGVIVVSILCLSVFFSVHYLTIYYLLQPYNAGTEMKSATYQIVLSITYFLCFIAMNIKMPTLTFGILCIAFCIIYCIVACILIYQFAPRTFKLRI